MAGQRFNILEDGTNPRRVRVRMVWSG